MIRWMTRRNRGQELVEYALTLPLLLLIVLGIMEFGLAILTYNSVANAAREGARAGAVVPVSPNDSIEEKEATIGPVVTEAITQRMVWLNLDEADIEVSLDPDDDRLLTVRVPYTHQLITGLIIQAVGGDAGLELQSVATMYREN